MTSSRFLRPALLLAALLASAAANAQVRYGLTDLSAFTGRPDFYTSGTAINDRGQVLIHASGHNLDAWLYTPGQGAIDLSTRIPPAAPDDHFLAVSGAGLNDRGQVTGTWYTSWLSPGKVVPPQVFMFSDAGGMRNLTAPFQEGGGAAINNAGLVAAQVRTSTSIDNRVALIDSATGATTLAPREFLMNGTPGLNEAGQLTGLVYAAGNLGVHAALYDRVRGVTDLGTLGGRVAYANDINESGWVVGESERRGNDGVGNTLVHPFLYKPGGGLQDLGGLASRPDLPHGAAIALNDAGQVVGTFSQKTGNWESTGFLYDPAYGALDLNDLLDPAARAAGWKVEYASSINNAGQIVGIGHFGESTRAILLTPVSAPVPEPAAALMLGLGAMLVVAGRRSWLSR